MLRITIDIVIDRVPALLPTDPIVPGFPLYECVAFVCDDPFDAKRPPERHRAFVWATHEEDVYHLSLDEVFDPLVRGRTLLNWHVRQVPPDTDLYADVLAQSWVMSGAVNDIETPRSS